MLKRVFEIDMDACAQCGGPLTLIATIEEPAVISKILLHFAYASSNSVTGPSRRVLANGLIPLTFQPRNSS